MITLSVCSLAALVQCSRHLRRTRRDVCELNVLLASMQRAVPEPTGGEHNLRHDAARRVPVADILHRIQAETVDPTPDLPGGQQPCGPDPLLPTGRPTVSSGAT